MKPPVPHDVRLKVARANGQGVSARECARRFGVSPSAAIKIAKRFRETGSIAPGRRNAGYRPIRLLGHMQTLVAIKAADPKMSWRNVKAALAERGIDGGAISTIWRAYKQTGGSPAAAIHMDHPGSARLVDGIIEKRLARRKRRMRGCSPDASTDHS